MDIKKIRLFSTLANLKRDRSYFKKCNYAKTTMGFSCLLLFSSTFASPINDKHISTEVTFDSDCRIQLTIANVDGDLYATDSSNFIEMSERPDFSVQGDTFTLPLRLSEDYERHGYDGYIFFVIGKSVDDSMEYSRLDIDYDVIAASASECINNGGTTPLYAKELTPDEIKQQAVELGISPEDYIQCPCGNVLASVQMQSPPWSNDTFKLNHGLNSCSLTTTKEGDKKDIDVNHASGSSGAKQVNCWVEVGSSSETGRIDRFRPKSPPYSAEKLQACYNIIQSKARQVIKSGGTVEFVFNPKNDPKTAQTMSGTLENLSCPTAG